MNAPVGPPPKRDADIFGGVVVACLFGIVLLIVLSILFN